ncbi:MAG: thioredoxin domain-containing protein [Planctomycetaceae bacterium]
MIETAKSNPNALVHETSPYLLQHAYNPVDWHPWGEDALRKARELDRPIFLSIGYSACHWCHVMEHESFENPEIAAVMNEHFINIKVDREERPDLDQIYMTAVVALTGRGGWPMSVFLTPELKPFYGGTYWPPVSRMGMPGFRDVLEKVNEAWTERRDAVTGGAEELTEAVVKLGRPQGTRAPLSDELLLRAQHALLRSADRTFGGFGGAPKFPHPMDIRLLLRLYRRFSKPEALDVVRLTLDKMAAGGIYDHLGGGFHRYSTDARWLVPHFEKMLYDNALLASTYLEAFQLTGDDEYGRVVRETLDYVLAEMTDPNGGFYSTQDADSEGVEGKFFVWSQEEIVDVLGPEDARIFNASFDVSVDGNWDGHNILNRTETYPRLAEMLDRDESELREILGRSRKKLHDVRSSRIPPGRDDKVLVSWNGLMISAMAQAASVLNETKYADAARAAADFILGSMRTQDGQLLHAYKAGRARFPAYLDDYAALIDGLVDLYQATFESRYADEALKLAATMIERFSDHRDGGFFYTSDVHEPLITRSKDSQDNATPSGNALAATCLLRLGRLTGRTDFEDEGRRTLEMLSGQLAQIPQAGGQSLIAVDFLLGPTWEIVVADGQSADENSAVLSLLRCRFLPNKVLLRRSADMRDDDLPASLRPLLLGKAARDGKVVTYMCQRGTCHEPLVGPAAVEAAIQ